MGKIVATEKPGRVRMMTPVAEALGPQGTRIRAASAEPAALYPLTPTARQDDDL